MRNSIISYEFAPKVPLQEDLDKQNNPSPLTTESTESKETNAELENEKADSQKRANVMHVIWGDNFLSDSLH